MTARSPVGFVDYTLSLDVGGLPTQTFYLSFGKELVGVSGAALPWRSGDEAVFTKADAGLSESREGAVVRQVNDIFSTFRIDVTAAKPEGEYSTIYIGVNVRTWALRITSGWKKAGPINLLGVAQAIDFDDTNKEDIAHVFSGEIGSPRTQELFRISRCLLLTRRHISGISTEVNNPEAAPNAP